MYNLYTAKSVVKFFSRSTFCNFYPTVGLYKRLCILGWCQRICLQYCSLQRWYV